MVGLDDRALKDSPAWNHMSKVVTHVVAERPNNALGVLESVSTYTSTGKLVPDANPSIYRDNRPAAKQIVAADVATDTDWATKFGQQLVPPKPVKKAGDEEEEPVEEESPGDAAVLPDVVSEQEVFNSFGEGLTEIESYRVVVALKRLLDKEPLAKVRFWGKILGSKKDYYIAEAKIDEARVPEKDIPDEEAAEQVGKPPETIYEGLNTYRARNAPRVAAEDAKGVNENKYYVATSSDLSNWVCLPDALPVHIIAARSIFKSFTGNLDGAVECHPAFPGVERHYLRAQIARISHTTTITPKDIFTTDAPEEEEEEEGKTVKKFEVKPYEEVPPLNPQEAPDAEDAEAVAPLAVWFNGYKHDELMETKQWVHIQPQLLTEGRATKFKPEDDEEVDPDDVIPEHPEWIHPFLCDVSNDKGLALKGHSKSSFPAWTVRKAYHSGSDAQRVYLARSLQWPGAYCYAVCEDDKPGAVSQNIYIGNGLKSLEGKVFAPVLPPTAAVEFPVKATLMKDCTHDDELEFEPAPPAPVVKEEDAEEEDE